MTIFSVHHWYSITNIYYFTLTAKTIVQCACSIFHRPVKKYQKGVAQTNSPKGIGKNRTRPILVKRHLFEVINLLAILLSLKI